MGLHTLCGFCRDGSSRDWVRDAEMWPDALEGIAGDTPVATDTRKTWQTQTYKP